MTTDPRVEIAKALRHRALAIRGLSWRTEARKADIALDERAADLINRQQAEIECWRKNSRETYEAMTAMRNSINEYIPMPSLESDLLSGPADSIFCARVAESVLERDAHTTDALLRAEAEIERLTNLAHEAGEEASVNAHAEEHYKTRAEKAEAEIERLWAERDDVREMMDSLLEELGPRFWTKDGDIRPDEAVSFAVEALGKAEARVAELRAERDEARENEKARGDWADGFQRLWGELLASGDMPDTGEADPVASALIWISTLRIRATVAEARVATLREAAKEAHRLIDREFYSSHAQALEGEYVEKVARPAWYALCTALASTKDRT